MFRDIFQGIKNLKEFLPVIWCDRDWDDWYIYRLLYVKLKKMEKFFEKSNWLNEIDNDQISSEIKDAVTLCEKVIKGDRYDIVGTDESISLVNIYENESSVNKFWDYIKDHISNWWE